MYQETINVPDTLPREQLRAFLETMGITLPEAESTWDNLSPAQRELLEKRLQNRENGIPWREAFASRNPHQG